MALYKLGLYSVRKEKRNSTESFRNNYHLKKEKKTRLSCLIPNFLRSMDTPVISIFFPREAGTICFGNVDLTSYFHGNTIWWNV